MKGVSSRSVQGILLGWTIAFEGFFALSIANTATVDGIGGIRASTLTMAAAQLTLLGVIISIVWTLKTSFPGLDKPLALKSIDLLTYLAMAMVAAEGLVMALMAGDVTITGFGGVGKRWVALTGAQLFALGILSLRLWRLRNVRPVNWPADLLGPLAAALLMLEGLTAMGIAGNTTIVGFGSILERTVSLAGAQLLLLGAVMFILWTLVHDPWLGPRLTTYLTERRSLIIMAVLGGIVALEAVAASTVAGTVLVNGSSGASKIYVVAGISQLFVLGLVSPLLWRLRLQRLGRPFLYAFLSSMAMALLAFEGVFAMALAANTRIEGVGGILESTFRMAGTQLLILSSIALLAWLIKDSPLLRTWPRRVASSVPILALGLVALEGLAAAVLAANLRIDDFGSVGERYVLMGGVQLVLLAALGLLCWGRSEGMSIRLRVTGTAAAAFLVLMLPITLLV